ncbi:hypothetical protein [Acetobacter sp. KSO5]|uniref:hypothetical protein n=1 Tax=Acetobacter sp. KSO5 TaxID=3373674 RepID=UPI00376F0F0D
MSNQKDVVVDVDGERKKLFTLVFQPNSDDVTIIFPKDSRDGIFEDNVYFGKNNDDIIKNLHISIHYAYRVDGESKITYKKIIENEKDGSKKHEKADGVTKALKLGSGACYVYSRLCSAMDGENYKSKREQEVRLNPYSKYFNTNYFSIIAANKNFKVENKHKINNRDINILKIECRKFDIYVFQSILDIPSCGSYYEAFKMTIGPNDFEKFGITTEQAENLKNSMSLKECISTHKHTCMSMLEALRKSYDRLYKYSPDKHFPNIREVRFYSLLPFVRMTKENGEEIDIPHVSLPFLYQYKRSIFE